MYRFAIALLLLVSSISAQTLSTTTLLPKYPGCSYAPSLDITGTHDLNITALPAASFHVPATVTSFYFQALQQPIHFPSINFKGWCGTMYGDPRHQIISVAQQHIKVNMSSVIGLNVYVQAISLVSLPTGYAVALSSAIHAEVH